MVNILQTSSKTFTNDLSNKTLEKPLFQHPQYIQLFIDIGIISLSQAYWNVPIYSKVIVWYYRIRGRGLKLAIEGKNKEAFTSWTPWKEYREQWMINLHDYSTVQHINIQVHNLLHWLQNDYLALS